MEQVERKTRKRGKGIMREKKGKRKYEMRTKNKKKINKENKN